MNRDPTSSFAAAGPGSETTAPHRHDGPINILIVDDEPKNLTVLESILDDPRYRLVRSESADQALLALVAEEFALLILDIRMPGMTGFELAQMVKARRKTAQVPIIFLTAYYNEDQHVLEGYGSGAVDYLQKPVNAAILRSKVSVFAELHRRNLEREMANRALMAEVAERRRAEEQLRELNETLEQRVLERTEALHASQNALKDADRRKDEFLATLAHELRNPLAPVRNAIEVIQLQGSPAAELRWAMDVISRQVRTMTRLIDDLMDVSRISRNELHLRTEPVELEKVIQVALETTRPLIDAQGHALALTLPQRSIVIDGDPTRLAQVFSNLLNNAAKYTERGGHIALHAQPNGSEVTVSVQDTGIGIPADKLPTIFEMFSQVEGALSRSQGGLGIGLSLVKRLVEMHGGRIEAKSGGPGRGSEFTVRLPIVVAAAQQAKTVDATPAEMPAPRLRVLVVDDNRDAAYSLSLLLETVGNNVCTAYDGEEAIQTASQFRPDIALIDIGLPKLNGYDVARSIRRETWGRDMILVAVTGWGQDSDKQMANEAGFDRHTVKPVDPQWLLRLMSELTQER